MITHREACKEAYQEASRNINEQSGESIPYPLAVRREVNVNKQTADGSNSTADTYNCYFLPDT